MRAEDPGKVWSDLDAAWQEAFRQAWEALRTGNIPVGACASTADGRIIHSARNRVSDHDGPPGETWGSAVAHAEVNVLARLPFRHHDELVLTTTLEPCLQCAGAIRLGPVDTVRFAGADRYWAGYHDFTKLSPKEAARPQARKVGPLPGTIGVFATFISRLGPSLTPKFEKSLRAAGEGPMIDLVHDLESAGEVERLARLEVNEAFRALAPRLDGLKGQPPA
ncbi:MAG TPA: nucleoside deaminase [Acidimicrobiales bacterium]|nr:nucleoside deaminase [Acidimicrobiales bacterium]